MKSIPRRLFLLALIALAAAPAWAADGAFTFAAINDIHLSSPETTALADRAIDKINADPQVKFTIVVGDLTATGKPAELELAKHALDRLKQPYFVVPGNHAVDGRNPDMLHAFRQQFPNPHWVHEEGGNTFIGFNSCEKGLSDVTVGVGEIAWLKERLASVDPKTPVFLFCHHPLNPSTVKYRVKNADDILALFKGHRLKLAAAGHWHGNQVETKDGILFTTTACCATGRDNFDGTKEKGYRLFHIKDGAVETETVVVE